MAGQELTTAQVADVVGCCSSYVRRWAARHGIDRTARKAGGVRRYYYPANAVHAALRPPEPVIAALRLTRFARNPLNWRP